MSWQKLLCQTSKELEEAVSEILEEAGAVAISYEDAEDNPVLEPLPGETPLWDQLIISALFPQEQNLETLLASLQEKFPQLAIEKSELADQQWERVWMEDYHPMRFGQNLWIYPTWSAIPDDDAVKIILDPGLAFGTGTHPTTSLCLQWLDAHPPAGLTTIDYGCGSGILAIAAIKLGARHCHATDIDEQALIATRENLKTNAIADGKIETCYPNQLPSDPVDLLMANILSGPLTKLAHTFAQLVKPSGHIVLSGILANQENAVYTAYLPYFSDLATEVSGDWLRITGLRRS